jgi:hypothetical protein
MDELIRLKQIIDDLGYLNIYMNMYLKNVHKKDNLNNIKEYINNNLTIWLSGGSRI